MFMLVFETGWKLCMRKLFSGICINKSAWTFIES